MGIGTDTMNAINKAAQELNGCVQEKFEPYEGVYRINDGDYVSEKNWKKVWNQYPSGGRTRGCSPATAPTAKPT